MKTRFLFVLFALIVMGHKIEAKNDTILTSPGDTIIILRVEAEVLKDSVQVQPNCSCIDSNRVTSPNSYPDDVSALTLAVNSANNVLTGETILVGILTLLVAILGLFGYRRFIKKVDEAKKAAEDLKKKNEKIEKIQSLNNQYLQSINQRILNNADAIAEAIGERNLERGKYLKEKSMVNYYLMKLYLSTDKTDKTEIDDCINYIKTQCSEEIINHLQFIIDNDPYKYKKNKASEAIGYIRARVLLSKPTSPASTDAA